MYALKLRIWSLRGADDGEFGSEIMGVGVSNWW